MATRLEEEGHRLYKQHKDAEAVAVYQRALLLYASSSTYYKFGNSLSNVDRLEDAVKAYDIAVALGDFQPELAHYNRACAYSRLKQADAAHAALTQAFDAGYAALEKLNTDPDLAFLRAQPDWQARIEKFRPIPTVLRGQFTEYGDRDYQESFALCPDRRVFQEVSSGLDGSCCGSTRQGQLGRRGDQLLVTWSRECGLRGVGGPQRKTEPEETCTPYVGCTQVAECRPRSGEKHLAKMTEIPTITKEPPGKPDVSTDLVYVPFPQDLPAVCTRPSL
jgi:tetratricopeptide (TPR) repeat protein